MAVNSNLTPEQQQFQKTQGYLSTYTSFAGSDLIVTIGSARIMELQAITWSVQREKAAVYFLGQKDASSFSRGKRGIAGGLIIGQLNRDALLAVCTRPEVWREIAPPAMFSPSGTLVSMNSGDFNQLLANTEFDTLGTKTSTNQNVPSNPDLVNQKKLAITTPDHFEVMHPDNITYVDMLPPFDITLTFANELGQAAFRKIYYVDILDESGGVSIDHLVMEQTMRFVARRLTPMITGVFQGGPGLQAIDAVHASSEKAHAGYSAAAYNVK